MNECEKLYDILSDDEFTTWNFLNEVNKIVSKYNGLDCLMNFNFVNGNIVQCICIITDWIPGALVFQSDDGDIPLMRIVFPEEYADFMGKVQHLFDFDYPKIPKEQIGE